MNSSPYRGSYAGEYGGNVYSSGGGGRPDNEYRLEYAKSGRSACSGRKPCSGHPIEINTLRFGSLVQANGQSWWKWRHWGCVTPTQWNNITGTYDSAEEIQGFAELEEEDKIRVREAFATLSVREEDIPETARKGKRTAMAVTMDETALDTAVEVAVEAKVKGISKKQAAQNKIAIKAAEAAEKTKKAAEAAEKRKQAKAKGKKAKGKKSKGKKSKVDELDSDDLEEEEEEAEESELSALSDSDKDDKKPVIKAPSTPIDDYNFGTRRRSTRVAAQKATISFTEMASDSEEDVKPVVKKPRTVKVKKEAV